ncbi:hypothetical protein CDL12_26928 [Handroanthus impetiginosus]|uniref:Late embryogenesis abundant protein LEA-2 subgroup domain-containing protein n=1 Tax=Handroanthus impetiginosus TaxID=429701 RepID=A0A2G9G5I4_9LAMI|nr:hypothetical protein CDL12_26928 [Handroanthus impetiginosus]
MSTAQPTPPAPLQKPPGYRDPTIPTRHPPPTRKAVKLPPSFYQNERRNSCYRTCCCCFCIVIFLLILLLIAAGATFYVWFQPRLPEVHLKSINFTKFNISAAADGPELDAETTVGVEIKNPSRNLGLEYGKSRVSLNAINGNVNLGEQLLNGFTQDKNNVTTLKFVMKVKNEILDEKSAQELKNGYKSKNLMVNVAVKTGIGFKGSGWKTGVVPAEVVCEGVRLNRVQAGGASPECRFMLVNWLSIN